MFIILFCWISLTTSIFITIILILKQKLTIQIITILKIVQTSFINVNMDNSKINKINLTNNAIRRSTSYEYLRNLTREIVI